METWGPIEVASFIRSLALGGNCDDAFKDNDISGDLLLLADHAMLRQLGIDSVGKRIAILLAIAARKNDSSPLSATAVPSDSKNTTLSDEFLLERMSTEILKLHNELANLRADLAPVWYLADEYK
ncbi:hypothetical protein HDU98_002300, partial [Podochytrium sp. JEL0797]